MNRSIRATASLLVWAAVYISAPIAGHAQDAVSVRRVQVLGKQNPLEIEIEATDRLIPQVQVLTGPDRLVVDFANTVPGPQLRNQTLNRAEVKSLRVGLFSSNPSVTRVVFDLNGPQAYQIFGSGRTLIVKLGSASPQAAQAAPSSTTAASVAKLVTTSYSIHSVQITPPAPPPPPSPLTVLFQSGMLTIESNQASLSQILFAVHERTGAEIAIPAGAEQEKVAAALGPAPAPEVLSRLLNGSRFNFLILSSANDPGTIDRVILSPRPDGAAMASMPLQPVVQANDNPNADAGPPPSPAPNPIPGQGSQNPETRPAPDNVPD
jgi:hypothetical protein